MYVYIYIYIYICIYLYIEREITYNISGARLLALSEGGQLLDLRLRLLLDR